MIVVSSVCPLSVLLIQPRSADYSHYSSDRFKGKYLDIFIFIMDFTIIIFGILIRLAFSLPYPPRRRLPDFKVRENTLNACFCFPFLFSAFLKDWPHHSLHEHVLSSHSIEFKSVILQQWLQLAELFINMYIARIT